MEPLVTVPWAIHSGHLHSSFLGFPIHMWEALRPAGSRTGQQVGWPVRWTGKVSHSQPPCWAELLGEAGSVMAGGSRQGRQSVWSEVPRPGAGTARQQGASSTHRDQAHG